MPIYKTAYDTLACHGFMLDKIRHPLEEAHARGSLAPITNSNAERLITSNDRLLEKIPSFDHPFALVLGDNPSHQHTVMVADLRRYGRYDVHQNEFVIKVRNDYQFQLTRTLLNQVWVDQPVTSLANASPLPMKLYGIWVADTISSRFYLDPHEKLKIQILASVFYAGLFYGSHDHWDKNRVAATVKRATGIDVNYINEIMEYVPQPMTTVIDFIAVANEVIDSVRIKGLNHGVLYAHLKRTWFGVNSDSVVAVALEHPPTWLAMLYSAILDRSYAKTQITQMVLSWDRRDKGQPLVLSLNRLMGL